MQPVDTYITLMAKNFGFSTELHLIQGIYGTVDQM